MSPDGRRVRALFHAALENPAEQRAAFLHEACGGDEALRARIEALLASHEQAGSFLERPAFPMNASGSGDESSRLQAASGFEGGTLGPYRLLQRVGEGGMGEVWLAEQTAPIRRNVALKVIKAGMHTRQVVARFEAERQALALMDHPAIAKVFDAGETPQGLPYFAMEFVKGEPLTTYCDRHRLPLKERLELFIQICEGVQHAHQKGVIHRDLKPSNVLVAVQDKEPVPKIIDFGVAKAIAQRLTERTMFTEQGVFIGTPEYMSPEQAEMTGLDIDTRTDVYALGIILYELLVGVLPVDREELRKAGFDEIRRRIREVDPPRPSTRISTMGEASTESARNRNTEPARLASQLKGDLDWITMKALEKDRTRRYGAPSELAEDLRRHLRHEPVAAGPPSAVYRARKFVRRHRVGVLAASALVLALTLGIAGTAAGLVRAIRAERRARQEAKTAQQVTAFLTDLFQVSDPGEARGNTITAREVLDQGVEKIQKELANQPEVQAQLMATMGTVYRNLGLYPKAEPLLRQVLEVRRRSLGPTHPDTLDAMLGLAWAYFPLGRYQEAEKLLLEGLKHQRKVLGNDHPDTLRTYEYLGGIYQNEGRFQEALEIHRKVLEARRRVLGENHLATLWSLGNIAVNLRELGDLPGAEKMFREVADRRRRVLGLDHPDTLHALSDLGRVCGRLGRYREAEKLLLEALETQRRILGEDHADTLVTQHTLAVTYQDEGRFQEALEIHRKVLETRRRVLGENHRETLWSLANIAVNLKSLGDLPGAEKMFREVVDRRRRVLGLDHRDTLRALKDLGNVCGSLGRYDEAERLLREAHEGQRRVLGEGHEETLDYFENLAWHYLAAGRKEDAEVLFREGLDTSRRFLGADAPNTVGYMNNLAAFYVRLGRLPQAEKLYLESADSQRRTQGPENEGTLTIMDNLASLYTTEGKYDEAEKLLLAVLATDRRVFGDEYRLTFSIMGNLALVYAKQGRHAEAERLFRETIEKKRRVFGKSNRSTLITTYKMGCAQALRGHRTQALDWLRQAVEQGYGDADRLATDPDCRSLNGDSDFEALVVAARKNLIK